jgi:GTPase SAR1 family protein
MYFETSAKTAQNVARAFEEVSKQLFHRILKKNNAESESNFKIDPRAKQEPSECC